MKVSIYIDVPNYATSMNDLVVSLKPAGKYGVKRYKVVVDIPDMHEPDVILSPAVGVLDGGMIVEE